MSFIETAKEILKLAQKINNIEIQQMVIELQQDCCHFRMKYNSYEKRILNLKILRLSIQN